MSTILATAMLMGAVTATPVMAASSMTNVGGWNESLYAEWTDSKPTAATVEYKLSSQSSYTALTGDDKAYLQRTKSGSTARVDIVGLTPGTYDLRITASDGTTLTKTGIVVNEYDRSGYAHFNYKEGVGAYNDDGTIKAKAKILYVTDANKDTVTVTSSDGTTVTGIGNILNSRGYADNGNNSILKKLSQDGTPLTVRFIGAVTAPKGLTAYDSTAFGGSVGDNGYMARMQSATNLTLEGIGYDAQIEGWGVHFIAETATSALGFGKSFEVRNITFDGAPEDAIGMEGQGDTTLTAPVERCWIHHCSFLPPKVSNPAESDKDGGDGACDFKRGMYFTNSYCYYENYHKTNLVGASDKNQQFNLTYHHNYWNKCESRGPLGRQANIHMYNNYFNGQTSYAMNTRANCYIFSEYNTLNKCKNPMRVDSGAIKSYKDNLVSCSEEMGGTVVTSKSTKVSSGNKYENFDTNASLSYIPSGDYKLTESAGEAMAECIAYSGPMKEIIITPDDVETSIISDENKPANFVSLPYNGTFTKDYVTATGRQVIDNIVFNATKVATDSITIKGEGVVFKVNTAVDVTMSGVSGSYSPVLYSADGTEYMQVHM